MAAKLTGITVTALGLGALGKPAVSSIMYPVFDYLNVPQSIATASSYAIAFILVTYHYMFSLNTYTYNKTSLSIWWYI